MEKTNKLIKNLIEEGVIKTESVKNVMKKIKRENFLPEQFKTYSELDTPFQIGYNVTISAPHMHAYALEFIHENLKKSKKCLDIGSGSGYLTLAMYLMSEDPNIKVYGIEHIKELADWSISNIKKEYQNLIEENKINIICGDGRKGLKDEAPFDCIHVGAAAENYPQDLIDQLNYNGVMLIPINNDFCKITKNSKGEILEEKLLGVRYVPLTDEKKQRNK